MRDADVPGYLLLLLVEEVGQVIAGGSADL